MDMKFLVPRLTNTEDICDTKNSCYYEIFINQHNSIKIYQIIRTIINNNMLENLLCFLYRIILLIHRKCAVSKDAIRSFLQSVCYYDPRGTINMEVYDASIVIFRSKLRFLYPLSTYGS